MDYTALVAEVRQTAGTDATPTQAGQWVNDRHKRLATESKWNKVAVSLGPTVADQASYALDASVADLLRLRVNGVPYEREGIDTLWSLQASEAYLGGRGNGAFAPRFEADGTPKVELWPVPGEAGLTIEGIAVKVPDTMAGSGSYTSPVIPEEFHPAIVAGAVADALRYLDENHPAAQAWNEVFLDGLSRLTRRANSRIGSRPFQIKVVGRHVGRLG